MTSENIQKLNLQKGDLINITFGHEQNPLVFRELTKAEIMHINQHGDMTLKTYESTDSDRHSGHRMWMGGEVRDTLEHVKGMVIQSITKYV